MFVLEAVIKGVTINIDVVIVPIKNKPPVADVKAIATAPNNALVHAIERLFTKLCFVIFIRPVA